MPYEFAPAYIAGNAESKAAVDKWMAENYGMTNEMIEASRKPNPPAPASTPSPMMGLGGGFGGGGNVNVGDPRGTVDQEALRVLAQGGKYDAGARRNEIAAQVMANNTAQAGASKPGGSNAWRDYWVQNYGADPNSPYFQGTEDWKGGFF